MRPFQRAARTRNRVTLAPTWPANGNGNGNAAGCQLCVRASEQAIFCVDAVAPEATGGWGGVGLGTGSRKCRFWLICTRTAGNEEMT